MKLFSMAANLDGYYAYMLASIEGKIDYEVRLIGPENWSWSAMVDFQEEMGDKYPDDLLIFIDLWDCLFVGDAKEMEEQLREMPMTLQSARACWPEKEKAKIIEEKYPNVTSPWKYVNGSGPFGLGKEIAEVVRYGKSKYPIRPMSKKFHPHDFPNNDNDQRFYTDIYIDGMAALDHNCDIVQCLPGLQPGELEYRDGRIHNLVTGSRPQFLHAANRTWNLIPKEVVRDKGVCFI